MRKITKLETKSIDLPMFKRVAAYAREIGRASCRERV